jgi:predicted RecA/RadA family phage recombinase
MKNMVYKKGDQFPVATAVAYVSGDIVLEGVLGGVAVADAENGSVVASWDGVFELPAVDASYTVGQEVEATAAQGSVQALSAGDLYGKVVEAATISGGGNIKVKLVG